MKKKIILSSLVLFVFVGAVSAAVSPIPDGCKVWFDGCNVCSSEKLGDPIDCTEMYCATIQESYCKEYFPSKACPANFPDPISLCGVSGKVVVVERDSNGCAIKYGCEEREKNRPPVIHGLDGPNTLGTNKQGVWRIKASDPENDNLRYRVYWGDENAWAPMLSTLERMDYDDFQQTTTFEHSYSRRGVYNVMVVVKDEANNTTRTTSTVRIQDTIIYQGCIDVYEPACGRPAQEVCGCVFDEDGVEEECSCPVSLEEKTYKNKCELNKDGAMFLYYGKCGNTIQVCPAVSEDFCKGGELSWKINDDGCDIPICDYPKSKPIPPTTLDLDKIIPIIQLLIKSDDDGLKQLLIGLLVKLLQ